MLKIIYSNLNDIFINQIIPNYEKFYNLLCSNAKPTFDC